MRSVISFTKQNNYAPSLGTIQTGWKWLYISSFSGHLGWWGGTVPFLMLLYSVLLQGNKLHLHPGPSYWLSHVSARGMMSGFLISSRQKKQLPRWGWFIIITETAWPISCQFNAGNKLLANVSRGVWWYLQTRKLGQGGSWLTGLTAVLGQRDRFAGCVKYSIPFTCIILLLKVVVWVAFLGNYVSMVRDPLAKAAHAPM